MSFLLTFRNSTNWSCASSGNPVAEYLNVFCLTDSLSALDNFDSGWMSNGSGGWSASENWDESGSSDWNKKFTQHEDYSATLNYSYTINQNGIRSNESFDETISGSGEIDRTSNDNESLNEEHSFSEGSWSGYASRYIKQDTQTKLDDKTSNTYSFDASRSSLNDTLTPENHLDSSRHSTKTVSGEYYLHTTFGGGGSPGGSETITDPLHDYTPIDEDHSETNSSPGFANQNSLPKLMKPLTTDGATGGIKGNYPATSTDSPPSPKSIKVDIPLVDKGAPGYGNFSIPDMDVALNPPPPSQPTPIEGVSENTWWNAFWGSYLGNDSTTANRIAGVAQAAGGAAQAIVAGGTAIVGLGLAPGTCGTSIIVTIGSGVVALNGLDNVQAGLRQAWTGKPVQTLTSSAVESATGSHLAGELVDAGIGLISPGGVRKVADLFKKTCFTAGTQVVVGTEYNGEGTGVEYVTVNIEDIKVGDLVYSYDTITGEVSQKEVTDTFVRTSNHINYLTIIDEGGNEQVIETTDSHPFWIVTDNPDLDRAASEIVSEDGTILYHENIGVTEHGYWVEAKDLRVGDVFLGANGELSILVSIERVEFPEGITVYNFAVDGKHDYFVIAQTDEFGQTCVLVHNANVQWYHGTDTESASDILKNGLNKEIMSQKTQVGNNKGFYVTDDIAMARHYAGNRTGYTGGSILVFDNRIIDFLIGDGTKLNEAVIPPERFNQITKDMIINIITL